VPGVGERNYCDAVAQQALAVWAREVGPSGTELRLRREARKEILKLARTIEAKGASAGR
jgi:hypothetical protein